MSNQDGKSVKEQILALINASNANGAAVSNDNDVDVGVEADRSGWLPEFRYSPDTQTSCWCGKPSAVFGVTGDPRAVEKSKLEFPEAERWYCAAHQPNVNYML